MANEHHYADALLLLVGLNRLVSVVDGNACKMSSLGLTQAQPGQSRPYSVELISTLGALFPRGGPVQDLVLTGRPPRLHCGCLILWPPHHLASLASHRAQIPPGMPGGIYIYIYRCIYMYIYKYVYIYI